MSPEISKIIAFLMLLPGQNQIALSTSSLISTCCAMLVTYYGSLFERYHPMYTSATHLLLVCFSLLLLSSFSSPFSTLISLIIRIGFSVVLNKRDELSECQLFQFLVIFRAPLSQLLYSKTNCQIRYDNARCH